MVLVVSSATSVRKSARATARFSPSLKTFSGSIPAIRTEGSVSRIIRLRVSPLCPVVLTVTLTVANLGTDPVYGAVKIANVQSAASSVCVYVAAGVVSPANVMEKVTVSETPKFSVL